MPDSAPQLNEDNSQKLTQGKLMKLLDWAYDRAIEGGLGFDSAIELAEDYQRGGGSPSSQAKSLVRWQVAKAGTSGFITGLGGVLVMPITVPANLASVMLIQLRMIAAIAHLGGHDVRSDRVRTLAYISLAGNAAKDIVKDVGIAVGTKVAVNAIKNVSGKTLTAINQKVGFRLLTKFGEKGAVNLGKAVPLVGGVIGGAFDSGTTYAVGKAARRIFIDEKL